ncbi:Pre-rRNA-processing protein TSR2 [Psilocybe cubensis]|uniref:Pre-rRNA-processing protein TSR2 n=2 Tax=Psilocybe cubensis TaxID=181762 RepID=A0A8H7XKP2_PSICU|nr:Pre-rRNA-processing protein TSR2 [Psilocybe cubensis]KAH9483284.1 Pre-rRNA-processing protein TSR2 [Psilocybe cubensis]
MDTSSQQSVPPPSSVLFARGVISRLAIWPILRVAVQENWGGPDAAAKRTWLASVIVDAFEEQTPTPDDQYVEEMILQIMEDEFEAVVEDGSAESVAQDIVRLWDESKVGTQDLVLKFEQLADGLKGKKTEVQVQVADGEEEWSDEDGDDDEAGDEAPQLLEHPIPKASKEPEIDEDGFTLVKGKGRR